MGRLESSKDVIALGSAKGEIVTNGLRWGFEFAEWNAKYRPWRDDHCPLDQVFQFADISRPRVAHEQVERFSGDRFHHAVHAPGMFFDKVAHERGNVFLPFAQRRHGKGKDAQTVV